MSAAMFGLHPARALACATATLLLWSAATPADAASRTTRATAAAGKATKAVKSRPRQARLAAAPAPTVAAPPVSAAEPTPETLQLQPGEQTVLRVSGRLLRVSLANDAVADVTPLHDAGGDSVRLRALAAGRSDLLLWTAGAAEPRRYTLGCAPAAASSPPAPTPVARAWMAAPPTCPRTTWHAANCSASATARTRRLTPAWSPSPAPSRSTCAWSSSAAPS
jgi:hypothetical protein